MDPDIKAFLLLIVNSLSMGILWMFVNMTFGIYYGFAFFENTPTIGNFIYWIFLIISFIFLIRYYKKKWKGWKEIGE